MRQDTPTAATADAQHRAGIQKIFELVAPRYDLMNDLMSMGTHRLWKHRVAHIAGAGHAKAVDLAGGTGDIAKLLANKGWRVTVCDPSEAMMDVGKQRCPNVEDWVVGLGEDLPFENNSVDLLTVGFGLRNMTQPQTALEEAYRTLKPGGMFICLEFSTTAAWLRPMYDWYSLHIIPRLGALVAGKREAYQYLVDSIRAFPDQETLKANMETVGFENVRYENLSFGIAAIHIGQKAR